MPGQAVGPAAAPAAIVRTGPSLLKTHCGSHELRVWQAPEPTISHALSGVLAMRFLTALATLGAVGGVSSDATAHNACSTNMYKRADASLVGAGSGWAPLLRHYETFASCDDGALAEGYSDAVVSLLARQWDQFDAFVRLSVRNPAFRRWAIRHIDASASTDDLTKVARNAAKCTTNADARDLCREIARAARNALNDWQTSMKLPK